jgi:hypothetical protein
MQATATIIREPNANPAEGTRSSHAAPSTETAAAIESPTAATLAAKEKQMARRVELNLEPTRLEAAQAAAHVNL